MKSNFSTNNYYSIFLIITVPLCLFLINHLFFKVYLHHDSLLMYLNYKFIYNYYLTYNNFPQWLDYINSGLDTSSIYLYDVSKIFFPSIIVGKIFNLNSYFVYLINLSLLNSIFIFGLYKNFGEEVLKKYLLILLIFISLGSNFIYKAFSANFEVFLSFPFIFYYLRQFCLKHKFISLIKIFIIVFLVYLNSIQYFSIFYIYFIIFFALIALIFQYQYNGKIHYKIKHVILFLILIASSITYFYFINFIISDNYYLPSRSDDLTIKDTKVFALYGYHSILLKTLAYLSNFYWWDVPLVTTNIGIFFTFLFFFSSINVYDFRFRFSILIFSFIILLLSETLLFYDFTKVLFNLPLLNYFRHFSFISIYLKPLLILTSILGIVVYFKVIENRNYKYLIKIKIYFLILYVVTFLLSYYLTIFLNEQINQLQNGNENTIIGKLFSDLSFFGVQDKVYLIDLFRGLKKQILISFTISYLSLFFIFILIILYLKNNNKKRFINIVILLLLGLIPNYTFNYLNYSFHPELNHYTTNKNDVIELKKTYEDIVINDNNFLKKNSVKMCNQSKDIHPLEELYKIIPKHTVLYENIYLFQKEKFCSPLQRWDFYINKDYLKYFNGNNNFLHFPKDINYLKITNEKFEIKNLEYNVNSNINFSNNWSIQSEKNNLIKIENYKGKIRLVLNGEKSKIPKVITLIYKNSLTFYLPYISITIGLILFIIIILNFIRFFSKNVTN